MKAPAPFLSTENYMGGIRQGIWTDNAAGLDTDLTLIGNPNIGTSDSPAGVIAAKQVTVVPGTLASTIPANGTIEFTGTALTIVVNGVRKAITVAP